MKITTENYTFEIHQDTNAESPREWGTVTQMIFAGKYKHLGDKHNVRFENGSYQSMEDFIVNGETYVRRKIKDVVFIKPVWLYNHSGMTISLKPFSCPWDSGVVGFVVVTKADIRRYFMKKRLSSKFLQENAQRIEEIVESEIETFDQWIRGDVYGYVVEDNNGGEDYHDSCWGFYGHNPTENGMLEHIEFEEVRQAIEKEFAAKA